MHDATTGCSLRSTCNLVTRRRSRLKHSGASRTAINWQPVNLWRVQRAVDEGRLDPSARITMRELRDSGAAGKRVQHGFKLLAKVLSGHCGPGTCHTRSFNLTTGSP